jgi:low temperature requirement protein LtrA
VAAFLDGAPQGALWAVALFVDYAVGGRRGIGGWWLSPGHFAERHGLIVIIALGESIIAIGVGAAEIDLGAHVIVAAALGVTISAALWWAYFDGGAVMVERRLHEQPRGRAQNTMARDAYSYLHLPMVAGIVLLALGVKKTIGDVDESLEVIPAFGICGGVALYLLAHVAVRARTTGRLDRERLVAAAACLALLPLAVSVPGAVTLACVAVVCVTLIAAEALRGARTAQVPAR